MLGPGDYTCELKTNTRWTITGRYNDYKTDEFPEPGAYDSKFQKKVPNTLCMVKDK